MAKFADLTGLTTLWSRVKTYFVRKNGNFSSGTLATLLSSVKSTGTVIGTYSLSTAYNQIATGYYGYVYIKDGTTSMGTILLFPIGDNTGKAYRITLQGSTVKNVYEV